MAQRIDQVFDTVKFDGEKVEVWKGDKQVVTLHDIKDCHFSFRRGYYHTPTEAVVRLKPDGKGELSVTFTADEGIEP